MKLVIDNSVTKYNQKWCRVNGYYNSDSREMCQSDQYIPDLQENSGAIRNGGPIIAFAILIIYVYFNFTVFIYTY